MFLALNEIRFDKARFALIVAIVALISFLTYFLTALAYGLASSYTDGLKKWDADGIVLRSEANDAIARSQLSGADYQQLAEVFPEESIAPLGASAATIRLEKSVDVSLFGYEPGSFVEPVVTAGRSVQGEREVVVSDELLSGDIALDDTISFVGDETPYKVVGATDKASFQASPLVYFEMDDWRTVTAQTSGMTAMRDDSTISAVVTRSAPTGPLPERYTWQQLQDFAFELPGYRAQVLTFGTMIGFLIVISSFVLAIFTYILTAQKKTVFGILKAEGIPTSYIGWSVLTQVLLLTLAGLFIGLMTTLLLGWSLGGAVPFAAQPAFLGVVSLLFIICSGLGAISSVRMVARIDPVEAIG